MGISVDWYLQAWWVITTTKHNNRYRDVCPIEELAYPDSYRMDAPGPTMYKRVCPRILAYPNSHHIVTWMNNDVLMFGTPDCA